MTRMSASAIRFSHVRHCEEAKPTKQSRAAQNCPGLLRYARNDEILFHRLDHTIALSARSLSFWQRSILAAWVITPALHRAKLTSATGSTQNIVLPAPQLPCVSGLASVPKRWWKTPLPRTWKPIPWLAGGTIHPAPSATRL